jgi:hypothetical protein
VQDLPGDPSSIFLIVPIIVIIIIIVVMIAVITLVLIDIAVVPTIAAAVLGASWRSDPEGDEDRSVVARPIESGAAASLQLLRKRSRCEHMVILVPDLGVSLVA